VLKKLSIKHLITHILPVVISLKHVLEATNSPLQRPLMEYLVYLMKQHQTEVDEALQFDPTLKAEIEYDLKQYEKSKRDSSQSPRLSLTAGSKLALPSTGPAAVLSSDRIHIPIGGTIVKPVLRKSLGGSEGRGRTPSEALKSPGDPTHLYPCSRKGNHVSYTCIYLYLGLQLGSDLIYSVVKTDGSRGRGMLTVLTVCHSLSTRISL